jgi:hypothetical protein
MREHPPDLRASLGLPGRRRCDAYQGDLRADGCVRLDLTDPVGVTARSAAFRMLLAGQGEAVCESNSWRAGAAVVEGHCFARGFGVCRP